MHLFYAPIQENGCCVLSEEESLHCSKVLRLKQGDLALVCNGKGGLYRCRFLSVTTKCCIAEIEEVLQEPNQNEIQRQASLVHVIVAPTKQMERMEWFLEKATDVG
ncbi:MAG: RNA methyltransferase PUA domain-containing protein, partial [Bacteroidales bacterium]